MDGTALKPTIVLAGSLAQKPHQAGHTWVFLQYLLGFRRLGWDVLFLDRLEPEMAIDAAGHACPAEASVNLRYVRDVFDRFGLSDAYSVACDGGSRHVGLPRQEVIARVSRAALFINVMGFVTDPEILAAAARRVFFDIDPGFGQMWHELGLHDPYDGYDAYLTIGERIGQPGCGVPTCGLEWITTRQPVVLDQWPSSDGPSDGRFTSIGSWRGPYGPLSYLGHTFGLRAHEFRKFVSLPKMTGKTFEVALNIHAAEASDLALLAENGWHLADPRVAARDPDAYRAYIAGSAAEFMVAKNMYVQTQSGWFSDRSICYLASGRPVLAEDTGLAGLYPLGEGLVSFSTLDEAIEGVREITGHYDAHSRAAREVAQDSFDSDTVLSRLLSTLGVG